MEKLHDFEEECMRDLAREKEYEKSTSTEERIHRTAERQVVLSFLNIVLLFIVDMVRLIFPFFSMQYFGWSNER